MARDEQLKLGPTGQNDPGIDQVQEPAAVSVPPEEPQPPDASDDGPPHDAIGAYVLDALPEDERASFEEHLAECPACQAELRELEPVVQVLPSALETERHAPPEMTQDDVDATPVPDSDLRSRILAAVTVREERPADAVTERQADELTDPVGVVDVNKDEQAVAVAGAEPIPPVPMPTRPPGRVRPGRARRQATTSDAGFWQSVSQLDRGWLAAAALAVVAVGAIIWSLALQGQVNDLKGEINAQNDEIAQLRGSANATAALLGPTADGPPKASGTLYYSVQANQQPVLALQGMNPLSNNHVYQLWYIKGDAAPIPGPTFQVNDSGATTVPVANDIPTYTTVAITAEPEGGSKTPTAPILMTGELSGARG